MEHGARPLRRNAARLLRHRRPHSGHGPRRHLGLAVLSFARLGFLRCGLLAGDGQGSRARLHAGLQRLASRGVGGNVPGSHHPPAAPLVGRRGGRRGRGQGQRSPRLQGGQLPGVPRPVAVALHLQRPMGSLLRRLRGHRDRCVPPHWRIVVGPPPLAGSTVRAVAHRVPRERPPRRRRMAVVRRGPPLPGPAGRAVRGWHRLGPDAHGPGRLRPESLGVGQREHRLALGPAAERGAPAQLLVLLH